MQHISSCVEYSEISDVIVNENCRSSGRVSNEERLRRGKSWNKGPSVHNDRSHNIDNHAVWSWYSFQ